MASFPLSSLCFLPPSLDGSSLYTSLRSSNVLVYPSIFFGVRSDIRGCRHSTFEKPARSKFCVFASEAPRKVFVAGGSGRTGQRVVRALAARRIPVRVGVRDVDRGKKAVLNGSIDESLLEFVAFDLEKPDSFADSIGDADAVVCAVGAPESDALNPTLPYRIDGAGSTNLVRGAAALKNIRHFVLVTSLGTGKFGWPAGILNLFWGVLVWKKQTEDALIASGIPFTIVRPGGMERPTDDYGLTHNVTLSPADTHFGGQVSRLQVAEVVAESLLHPTDSENKILEVIALTEAPKTPISELLKTVPKVK